MKKILLSLLCLFSFLCYAEEWFKIGPPDVKVFDYLCYPQGIFVTESGIMIDSSGVWKTYSDCTLPIRDVNYLNNDSILVIGGCGSDSDGLFIFNLETKSFHLVEYLACPQFIHREPIESAYYVGHQFGCKMSEDGITWHEIPIFNGKECYDMASQQGYYVISTSDGIYYSAVFMSMWQKSEDNIYFTALTSDWQGKFYGIFPESWSGGVYVSKDHGETWSVEFYTHNCSAIYYNYGYLFVGWQEEWVNHRGVAIWDTTNKQLHFINNGLPDAAVNKFSTNDIIDFDWINIICCTDAGAYFSSDFEPTVIMDPDKITIPEQFELHQNYPNPFNPSTTITYQLPKSSKVELSIFNLLGQKVATLVSKRQQAGQHQVKWDASAFSSSIYYFKIQADEFRQIKKMVLVR